jgi:hypothetical protein
VVSSFSFYFVRPALKTLNADEQAIEMVAWVVFEHNLHDASFPGPPDIVEQPKEIVNFRSRGGRPDGHPEGARAKR